MPLKLRNKIILESQDLVFDIAEAAHEGFVQAMVEQFERNTIIFLQGEFALDNLFGQEAGIGSINDDDIHVPNPVEFQAMIKNL